MRNIFYAALFVAVSVMYLRAESYDAPDRQSFVLPYFTFVCLAEAQRLNDPEPEARVAEVFERQAWRLVEQFDVESDEIERVYDDAIEAASDATSLADCIIMSNNYVH